MIKFRFKHELNSLLTLSFTWLHSLSKGSSVSDCKFRNKTLSSRSRQNRLSLILRLWRPVKTTANSTRPEACPGTLSALSEACQTKLTGSVCPNLQCNKEVLHYSCATKGKWSGWILGTSTWLIDWGIGTIHGYFNVGWI